MSSMRRGRRRCGVIDGIVVHANCTRVQHGYGHLHDGGALDDGALDDDDDDDEWACYILTPRRQSTKSTMLKCLGPEASAAGRRAAHPQPPDGRRRRQLRGLGRERACGRDNSWTPPVPLRDLSPRPHIKRDPRELWSGCGACIKTTSPAWTAVPKPRRLSCIGLANRHASAPCERERGNGPWDAAATSRRRRGGVRGMRVRGRILANGEWRAHGAGQHGSPP